MFSCTGKVNETGIKHFIKKLIKLTFIYIIIASPKKCDGGFICDKVGINNNFFFKKIYIYIHKK